ncbi:hypothetical protein LUZ60_004096 [Juncus effusus]|nr:hypothetical protein LUZ60_004096 [Juncus effusus]
MAEVCCEVAPSTDGTTTKSIGVARSRTARRRRMEIQRLRTSPDSQDLLNRKRQRQRQRLEEPASLMKDESLGPIEKCPRHGMSSVCGRRRDMEDAVSVHPNFVQIGCDYHFYGVFDGHGCSHVAISCQDRLHKIVSEEMMKNKVDEEEEEAKGENWWKEVMERSYSKMDAEVVDGRAKPVSPNCPCGFKTPKSDHVGSTAVVSVVGPTHLVVANCGDSRAVLFKNGIAVPLSSDHKPDRPDELKRIEDAGGRVIYWDGARVLGMLAMSRAIGDSYLKPYVISEPEVTVTERSQSDEFLIMASDGLWDVLTNEKACQIVRTFLRTRSEKAAQVGESDEAGGVSGLDQACTDAAVLLTKIAFGKQSGDNISVIVVNLRGGNS